MRRGLCKTELIRSDGGDRLDELLDALADQHRRYALYYLRQEHRAEVDDLAIHVAVSDHDIPACNLSDDVIENTKIKLHHVHLPKLAAAAVVEHDPRSNEVVYREPPEAVETFLEYCAEHEPPG